MLRIIWIVDVDDDIIIDGRSTTIDPILFWLTYTWTWLNAGWQLNRIFCLELIVRNLSMNWSIPNEAITLTDDFLRVIWNHFLTTVGHVLNTSISLSIFVSTASLTDTLGVLRFHGCRIVSLGLALISYHAIIETHFRYFIHRVKSILNDPCLFNESIASPLCSLSNIYSFRPRCISFILGFFCMVIIFLLRGNMLSDDI